MVGVKQVVTKKTREKRRAMHGEGEMGRKIKCKYKSMVCETELKKGDSVGRKWGEKQDERERKVDTSLFEKGGNVRKEENGKQRGDATRGADRGETVNVNG